MVLGGELGYRLWAHRALDVTMEFDLRQLVERVFKLHATVPLWAFGPISPRRRGRIVPMVQQNSKGWAATSRRADF